MIGEFLIPCAERKSTSVSSCNNSPRVRHPVYHHDLSKNYRGLEHWYNEKYFLCTDSNGFRISCNLNGESTKDFDIAFIGDSFTEGIGLEYENTFVGQIAENRPDLKIANLGVSGYSPSIYFSKINFLLKKGIWFKEVVVYLDISDIQDEALDYTLSDFVVVSKQKNNDLSSSYLRFNQFLRWSFPLIYSAFSKLNTSHINPSKFEDHLRFDYERSAWTYKPSSIGYGEGGIKGGLEQSLRTMIKLSDLLRASGINLSVGVYPWPAQLLYDQRQSEQVRIWKGFCSTRCVNFYNSFESFFNLKENFSAQEVIDYYFIRGDVHHNRHGAKVIAHDFLSSTNK
jgi:hypothetical protein